MTTMMINTSSTPRNNEGLDKAYVQGSKPCRGTQQQPIDDIEESSGSSNKKKNSNIFSSDPDDDDDDFVLPNELLECEEVDMEDELMDPLEWTVRKIVSIPKTYYWELPEDKKIDDSTQIPIRIILWHRSVAAMGMIVRLTDQIGKPITDALGLTSSRFDYVTSTMTEEDLQYSKLQQEQYQQQRIKQKKEEEEEQSQDVLQICE